MRLTEPMWAYRPRAWAHSRAARAGLFLTRHQFREKRVFSERTPPALSPALAFWVCSPIIMSAVDPDRETIIEALSPTVAIQSVQGAENCHPELQTRYTNPREPRGIIWAFSRDAKRCARQGGSNDGLQSIVDIGCCQWRGLDADRKRRVPRLLVRDIGRRAAARIPNPNFSIKKRRTSALERPASAR